MNVQDVRETKLGVDGAMAQFERTRLYSSVFAAADRLHGKPVPRAVLPTIVLHTVKTTRKLTSDGFATRVAERHRTCLARDFLRQP